MRISAVGGALMAASMYQMNSKKLEPKADLQAKSLQKGSEEVAEAASPAALDDEEAEGGFHVVA